WQGKRNAIERDDTAEDHAYITACEHDVPLGRRAVRRHTFVLRMFSANTRQLTPPRPTSCMMPRGSSTTSTTMTAPVKTRSHCCTKFDEPLLIADRCLMAR